MIALFNKKTVVGGSRELVWTRISDCNGHSLDAFDVSLAILPEDQRPAGADWKTPNTVTHAGRTIRASLLFDAPIPPVGQRQVYTLYARTTDAPEDIWTICGQLTVI